jgi:tetratricopeptide (TPR) repeat protein
MSFNTSAEPAKRGLTFVRVLIVVVLLAIGAVSFLGKKHSDMVKVCNLGLGEPQDALATCDFLLKWTAYEPSTRSLLYRHRMRIFMVQEDWVAAEVEADLAISEDPQNPVPWNWKALVLARAENYPEALRVVETTLGFAPGNDYTLETKAKLLQRMDRYDEIEPLVEDAIANYDVGVWAWNTAGSLRLRKKAYQAAAVAFAGGLAVDPANIRSRKKFFETCRLAASDCPDLFPEQFMEIPLQSCDEAIENLWIAFPNWPQDFGEGEQYESALHYVYSVSPLQSGIFQSYVNGLRGVELGANGTFVQMFAQLDRALACVHEARSDLAPNTLETKLQGDFDRIFPAQLRGNAVRWATKVASM